MSQATHRPQVMDEDSLSTNQNSGFAASVQSQTWNLIRLLPISVHRFIGKGLGETLKGLWVSFKIQESNIFSMIYGQPKVNIFVFVSTWVKKLLEIGKMFKVLTREFIVGKDYHYINIYGLPYIIKHWSLLHAMNGLKIKSNGMLRTSLKNS